MLASAPGLRKVWKCLACDHHVGPALYHPPTDDNAPLDPIEQAFVRMIVELVVEEIREEELARARAALAERTSEDAQKGSR
jgi:hypothetical protein